MDKRVILAMLVVVVSVVVLVTSVESCYAGVKEEGKAWVAWVDRQPDSLLKRFDVHYRLHELEGRMDRLEAAQEELEEREDVERMEEFYEAITDPDVENYAPYEKKK